MPMTETRCSIVVSKPCRADLQSRSHVLVHTQNVRLWATVKARTQEHGTERGTEHRTEIRCKCAGYKMVDNLAEMVDECPLNRGC